MMNNSVQITTVLRNLRESMKNYLILLVFIFTIWGCQKQENIKANIEPAEAVVDTTGYAELFAKGNVVTKAYYYEPLQDTIYVDYVFEKEENVKPDYTPESYFIVTGFSANVQDNKFNNELARWQALEETCYLETYGTGKLKKYFVSLGKYHSMKEVIAAFNEFKLKYPHEKINFYSINQ